MKGIRISKWLLGENTKGGSGSLYRCGGLSYSSFHVIFVLILKQGLTPLRCNALVSLSKFWSYQPR